MFTIIDRGEDEVWSSWLEIVEEGKDPLAPSILISYSEPDREEALALAQRVAEALNREETNGPEGG